MTTVPAWRSPLDARELREVLACLKRHWQPVELPPVFDDLDLALAEVAPTPDEIRGGLMDRLRGSLADLIKVVDADDEHAPDPPGVEALVVRGRLLLAEPVPVGRGPLLGLLRRVAWTVSDLLDHMIEHRYLLDID